MLQEMEEVGKLKKINRWMGGIKAVLWIAKNKALLYTTFI
jgi:hypothetical protein